MKHQAVVVGGSNGTGLAITKQLINDGYFVHILDVCQPDKKYLNDLENYSFNYCDIANLDEDLIIKLSQNKNVKFLMITAGIGRVSDFEYLHISEIEKLFKINSMGTIKILSLFYNRIKSKDRFYCGIMGSIAGLVSSPMFSVYAATKAAVCRFTESVNIEIEKYGSSNRITNISPGSIKGTRFNGGDNNLDLINDIAKQIIEQVKNSNELFIPQYEEIFEGVISRYKADAHKFGLSSYEYKKESGRAKNEFCVKIGYLSGTFDLFHIGHLNLLERAKQKCDYLIVGVHKTAAHKGKETFIPFEERMKIVGACKYVDKVVEACSEDSDAWNLWNYDRLFVGSDYKGSERFKRYEEFFADKGVEIIYFPYTQKTSSTQLRKTILTEIN